METSFLDRPPSVIHTKKPSLPIFSGERSDWPEFKCVWRPLAEGQFINKMQLALELKRCCKGRAAERIRHIYVTNNNAYDEIWQRLGDEYDDPGMSSQEAITRLMSLRPVEEQDYPGMVKLIDTVEGVHNQLKELNQLSPVHAVDVDRICVNLPRTTQMEWLRRYRDLSSPEKLSPFSEFFSFLLRERAAVARMAETMPRNRYKAKDGKTKPEYASTHVGQGFKLAKPMHSCAVHGEGHLTEDCRNFQNMTVQQRYNALRKEKRCFNCFQGHPRDTCSSPPCKCSKTHHKLLCTAFQPPEEEVGNEVDQAEAHKQSYLVDTGTLALYPICPAYVTGSSKPINVFMDSGSNATYVTSKCAKRFKLRNIENVSLNVTTVGGEEKEYKSSIYEIPLRTSDSKVIKLTAYELPEITGQLSQLNRNVLASLFPNHDHDVLMRNTDTVDLLIGTDYYGLHPKHEVARAGENLSVMRGELGVCLVGTHPLLKESTVLNSDVPRTLHLSEHRTHANHIALKGEHPFAISESLIVGEELELDSNPKSSDCECPLPGHDLSFEKENLNRLQPDLVVENADYTDAVSGTNYVLDNRVVDELTVVEQNVVLDSAVVSDQMYDSESYFYSVPTFFSAKVFCNVIPMTMIICFIISCINYCMVCLRHQPERYFFALILFLTVMSVSVLPFFHGSFIRILAMVNLVLALCYVFIMLLSVLLLNANNLGDWVNSTKYLSIFRYSLKALEVNGLKDQLFLILLMALMSVCQALLILFHRP